MALYAILFHVSRHCFVNRLPLNKNTIQIERNELITTKTIDTESVIVNDRMYIPIRFISELFGFQVSWDGEYNEVHIFNLKDSNGKNNNDIPIKIIKATEKTNSLSKMITPEIPVHYSPTSQNLEEIIAYIKNYIDPQFNINNFEVKTNLSSNIVAGEIRSTAVSMNLKKGNFIFKDGYKININNGSVDTILITGNPSSSLDNSESTLINNIDVKWLINLAMKNINIPEGYHVVKYTIFEKKDSKIYYDVRVEFESFQGFGHIESFIYEIE